MADMSPDFTNGESFVDNEALAMEELRREEAAGFCISSEQRSDLEKRVGVLFPSKIAALVKEKDGRVNTRLIHDLRRSGINSRANCPERVVLPRVMDVIRMALKVIRESGGDPVEWLSLDFSVAFKQLLVALSEQKYLSGRTGRRWFVYFLSALRDRVRPLGLGPGRRSRHAGVGKLGLRVREFRAQSVQRIFPQPT